MVATRRLRFKSTELGENVILMLCFTPPLPKLYVDQFPVAWKVTSLAATGRSTLDATWTNTLGFNATQVDSGSIVTAGNYMPIQAGQMTSLLLDQNTKPPIQHWTPPKNLPGVKHVQAVNATDGPAGIGIGFITDLEKPTEDLNLAMVWPKVGSQLAVVGDFTPILSAYITLNYQENEIIRGEIRSSKPIWSGNLLSLTSNTTILVSRDATGAYIGTQVEISRAMVQRDLGGRTEGDSEHDGNLDKLATQQDETDTPDSEDAAGGRVQTLAGYGNTRAPRKVRVTC